MITSLPIRSHTALYHAYTEDIMYMNNEKFHSRINRIVSLEIGVEKDVNFIYTLEMFRRSQVTNYMQQAEKDFWNNLAYVYDKVQIFADYNGNARKLLNEEEIQKKLSETIEEISREYKGEAVRQVLNGIEAAGNDVNLLFRQFLEYKFYGLIFTGLYEQVRGHLRKRRLLDIFGAKDLIVEERFLPKEVRNEKNEECLNFKVQGKIVDYCRGDWESEAGHLGLQITETQQPILNRYDGEVTINATTSVLEKAEINLSLSFGEKYKREQVFSLLLLSEEDMDDLF